MVLLASNYDKSRFLKAADQAGEEVPDQGRHRREVRQDGDKEKKLVVWFTNDKRGWCSTRPTTARSAAPSATTRPTGPARSSSCSPRWSIPRQDGPALRVRIPPPKQAHRHTYQPGSRCYRAADGASSRHAARRGSDPELDRIR